MWDEDRAVRKAAAKCCTWCEWLKARPLSSKFNLEILLKSWQVPLRLEFFDMPRFDQDLWSWHILWSR